ncbi:hypothetical protein EV641_101526 [Rhodococcus sp. SMB37]|uniref:hypothetical protein n=1 Tax=Rhodococcus sp. SMB37 TaxID=2512213 RepID=UPI001050C8C5|nr:hypothetical protein [Rhodococcus sp. SMB37]TCN58423.1 hypothetical protein EV641_101526 [Rhodococcus sp. SMB37]
MCYPVACSRCNKTGWGGCGQHVDVVMRSVPAADRCTCDQSTAVSTRRPRPGLRSLFRSGR